MKVLIAQEGKTWAYMYNDERIILGSKIYLGKNDDGSKYFEIDLPREDDVEHNII